MSTKLKYKIYSLGCKVNQYDAGKLSGFLKSADFELVEEGADLAIVNTCSVTKSAITKDKTMLNKAKKENPGAKIVLMGCWPKVYANDVDKYVSGVDLVWPTGRTKELFKEIKRTLEIEENQCDLTSHIELNKTENRSRYFLKVQDGCEQFCAYCVIPYTRGKLQSRFIKEVIEEAKLAVKNGYHEIVLCGIHLGLFGINNVDPSKKEEGVNLVNLIKELINIEGLEKIRLSSIEVTEVTDELIDLMSNNEKLCQHLHISLQSGCDKTLKAMNRPYSTEYFRNRVNKLRQRMPDVSISTDVITGFPNETEEDFQTTLDFIKEVNFSRLHVFSFSAHEKTPAYTMDNKVNLKEIKKRSSILRDLDKKLQEKYKNKFKGKEIEVLIEAIQEERIKGKTEFYFDVWFTKDIIINKNLDINKKLIGKIIKIKF